MTDFLVWREQWLLNIEPIDNDHREMVRLLNLLASHGVQTNDDVTLKIFIRHFDAFIAHVNDHFEREETFLSSINYPNYQKHRREHTIQRAVFTAFKHQIVDSRMNDFEAEDLNWIKMWFLDHVFGEDKEYANFYHEQQGRGSL